MESWLEIRQGDAPLIVAFPHTGIEIPLEIERKLLSPALARGDTDWWVHRLYDFAPQLGATTLRTRISRTVIDVNRDPSGQSLYPGLATTELCPATTFDGDPLYISGNEPDEAEIASRRARFFDPYHRALAAEIERLQRRYRHIVVYDAHSIRSRVPRLFEGELPNFNIGTYNGTTCDPALTAAVEAACSVAPFTRITNGRFKGGWTTRHYGQPQSGVHAIQMELAIRGYMREPMPPEPWPPAYDAAYAAPMRNALINVLKACLAFAETIGDTRP
ncbi:MAG TPA: N-formylglutamate deformylase [Steroidobacteraceae bacterium]